MKTFQTRLAKLEAGAFEAFEDDEAYKRVRSDVFDLLVKAHKALSSDDYAAFKSSAMEVFCRICGTHLDLEVLEAYTPSVLSSEEFDMITQNSALARWM
ncbi:MAG: hypothetical protein R3B94_09195 [Hyphomonas sp.]